MKALALGGGASRPESEGPVASGGQRALLFVERGDVVPAADLNRFRGWRRRYEDLCVAAAMCRMECRRLTARAEHERASSQRDRCLLVGLELRLVTVKQALEKMEKWLPPAARRRAQAKAQERVQTIVAEVKRELATKIEFASQGAEPTEEVSGPATAVEPGRCAATTRKGTRCKHPAKTGRRCELHARMAETVTMASPPQAAEGRQPPAAIRENMPRPEPRTTGATLELVGFENLATVWPGLRLPEGIGRWHRTRRLRGRQPDARMGRELSSVARRLPALMGLNAAIGWAIGALVALAVAVALV